MSQQTFNIASAIQMAFTLYQSKKYHECVDICIQILSVDCTRADVWSLAGIVMLEFRIYERAIEYFTQACQCAPNEPSHRLNLAEAYRRNGQARLCIDELYALLKQDSAMEDNPTLHFNLARAYADLEDSNQSIKHYTIAIKLDPNDLGAMFNLANAQVSLKQFGQAIELYLNAFSKGYLDAGVNLASTYVQIGLFSEALEVYSALYEHYRDDSEFIFNYANALQYAKADAQHTQALYQQAISLNPKRAEYYINYAHFLLRTLHFAQGFRIYEARKELPNMLPQGISHIWEFSEEGVQAFKDKDVLVYYEQGLGDSIMFARFVPALQQYAKSVRVIVQEPLVKFFTFMDIPSVACMSEVGHYDSAISLLSLPLALNVSHTKDLQHTPFMRTTKPTKHVRKIGICFSTDSKFTESSLKNIPLNELMSVLQPFMQSHGVKIYSLNKAKCEHIAQYDVISQEMNDFFDTYEIINGLDMVISIDSAVAHLSASMGKHTIVLLHKRYDWRWGNGISTPWYENVVCMAQSKMNDWSDVAENLSAYLKAWI